MTADVRRHLPLTFAVLFALASSDAGFAQTRLYLLTAGPWTADCSQSPCEPGRVVQVDLDRGQVVSETPVRHSRSFVTRPRVTPDGRHLVWFGSEHVGDAPRVLPVVLSLFDIGARHQTASFTADPTLNSVSFSLHPSVVRGFFQLSEFGPVVVAEPDRTTTLPLPCAQSLLGGRSGDGRRLSFWCGLETAVMDSDSGQILARIPEVYGSHTLNETGTELFAAYWDWEGWYLPDTNGGTSPPGRCWRGARPQPTSSMAGSGD